MASSVSTPASASPPTSTSPAPSFTAFNSHECVAYHSKGWKKLWGQSHDENIAKGEKPEIHQSTVPAWGTPTKPPNSMSNGQSFLSTLAKASKSDRQ